MKRMTASEARRSWFRLLDEVAAGEVVVIARKGRRILIKREAENRSLREDHPDYAGLVRATDIENAADWGWDWDGPESELKLREGSDKE